MKYFLGLMLILFHGIQDIRTKEFRVSLDNDSPTQRGGNVSFKAVVHADYNSDSLCKKYPFKNAQIFHKGQEFRGLACHAYFRYTFRDKTATSQHYHEDKDFSIDRTRRTITFDYPKKVYEAANYTAEVEVEMKVIYTEYYRKFAYRDVWGDHWYHYRKYHEQVFQLKPKPAITTFILTEKTWPVKWDRSLPFINPPIFITIFLSIFFGLHIMVHF